MLKALAAAIVLICSSAAAWADNSSDCVQSKDWPTVIRACSAIIASRPRDGWGYINRSYGYERNKQYDLALSDGNRGVELSPRDPQAYVNRAAAYIGLTDYQRAITDLNRAIQLNPGHSNAFVNRAYAHQKLGERDRAIADYRRALEINPNERYAADALDDLGVKP